MTVGTEFCNITSNVLVTLNSWERCTFVSFKRLQVKWYHWDHWYTIDIIWRWANTAIIWLKRKRTVHGSSIWIQVYLQQIANELPVLVNQSINDGRGLLLFQTGSKSSNTKNSIWRSAVCFFWSTWLFTEDGLQPSQATPDKVMETIKTLKPLIYRIIWVASLVIHRNSFLEEFPISADLIDVIELDLESPPAVGGERPTIRNDG